MEYFLNEGENWFAALTKSVVQGSLCHGSQAEKLMHHESRIFKFYFEALHVSRVANHEEYFLKVTFLGK